MTLRLHATVLGDSTLFTPKRALTPSAPASPSLAAPCADDGEATPDSSVQGKRR